MAATRPHNLIYKGLVCRHRRSLVNSNMYSGELLLGSIIPIMLPIAGSTRESSRLRCLEMDPCDRY